MSTVEQIQSRAEEGVGTESAGAGHDRFSMTQANGSEI